MKRIEFECGCIIWFYPNQSVYNMVVYCDKHGDIKEKIDYEKANRIIKEKLK